MKRIAILQSNYIPWKGYFDILGSVDEFVVYDEVQYTKNDWRNRNVIKASKGPLWLTIPVRHTGRFGQTIDSTEVSDPRWTKKHWQTLVTYYSKAPYFGSVGEVLEETYRQCQGEKYLSAVNLRFIRVVAALLGITTPIVSSRDIPGGGDRNERLLDICLSAGADSYLSGPAARGYLDEAKFSGAGVTVNWMDYSGYPEYPQLHGAPFIHEVSVLDLLLCVGPEQARHFMRCLPAGCLSGAV